MHGANGSLLSVLVLMVCLPGAARGQDKVCNDTMQLKLTNLDTDRAQRLALARDFLWQHWADKKCGELFITAVTLEGGPTEQQYAISIAPSGEMLLTHSGFGEYSALASSSPLPPPPRRNTRSIAAPPPPGTLHYVKQRETSSYVAYQVVRVWFSTPTGIPEKSDIVPTGRRSLSPKYYLRFEDIEGRQIAEF